MPAYVVALIDTITDPETYASYVAKVQDTLTPFGGRFIARKPDPQALEGGPAPSRAIILEFASEGDARAWHASPPYQPVMKMRQSASNGMLLVLPGYDAGAAPQVAVHDVCYIEVVSADVAMTRRYYEESHGWVFADADPVLGGAVIATLPNGARAAIRASMSEEEKPLTRTYVRVPDLDAAVARLGPLGSDVLLPEMVLPGHGRIAIHRVGGVEHGIWELPRAA